MAGKKKDKKTAKKARKAEMKAAKKASKAEMKAAKKARKLARKQAKQLASRPVVEKAKARAKVRGKAPVGKAAKGVVRRRKPKPPTLKERQQPESLRLRSASPGFTVNDIEKSLAFYRDVLLFVVEERWEEGGVLRGVEVAAGSVTLWLSQDDWKKGRDRLKGQGFRVYCTTAQDIDALAQGIKARGGTLAEEPQDRPWGGRDFAVADPDGFTITIASEG